MYTDIKQKIKKQRIHLTSMQHFLIKQIELKNEIKEFEQISEKKLNRALQGEHSAQKESLRERLTNDQCLYTERLAFINELQTEIITTKIAIKKSRLKLQQLFYPKKNSCFFKQQTEMEQTTHFDINPGISQNF